METSKRTSLRFALLILAGYVLIYLLGRVFGTTPGEYSVLGWLFGTNPQQLSYLYGWLVHGNLYWLSMAVSIVPALFKKRRFALSTLAGFALGLLLGELLGANPAGAATGHTHYGWAIWGGVFLASIAIGIVLEKKFHKPS